MLPKRISSGWKKQLFYDSFKFDIFPRNKYQCKSTRIASAVVSVVKPSGVSYSECTGLSNKSLALQYHKYFSLGSIGTKIIPTSVTMTISRRIKPSRNDMHLGSMHLPSPFHPASRHVLRCHWEPGDRLLFFSSRNLWMNLYHSA